MAWPRALTPGKITSPAPSLAWRFTAKNFLFRKLQLLNHTKPMEDQLLQGYPHHQHCRTSLRHHDSSAIQHIYDARQLLCPAGNHRFFVWQRKDPLLSLAFSPTYFNWQCMQNQSACLLFSICFPSALNANPASFNPKSSRFSQSLDPKTPTPRPPAGSIELFYHR